MSVTVESLQDAIVAQVDPRVDTEFKRAAMQVSSKRFEVFHHL